MPSQILDNIEDIKKVDQKDMLSSLVLLPDQVEQITESAKKIKIPSAFAKVKSLIIVGMGGSALGGDILKSLFFSDLRIPIEVVRGYHIPAYADKSTLVILSSYSGSTEEVLSALKDCKIKKCKLLIICSGGSLQELAKQYKIPALIFSTENNPCGSPRMGLGFSIFGLMALLCRVGLVKCSSQKVKEAINVLKKYDSQFGAKAFGEKNIAKTIANKLLGRAAVIVSAEHLSGSAHVASNQINENSKRFAGYFLLPELNNHLMEGLLLPKSNSENLFFIMIESNLFDLRVQKRFDITKKVLEKNKISYFAYKCEEKDRLLQLCEVLSLFSYASYYAALLEGIDPTPNQYVDFFKEELRK